MRSATSPVHHAMSSLKAPPAASPASPAARAWVPVLSLPRSRAAMIDPPLERRQAQAGQKELAGDDRSDHPRGQDTADDHDQGGHDEQLVCDRVEQASEIGRLIGSARVPAVEPVGRHRDREEPRCPVVVAGKVPGEKDDDDRDGESARDRELVREVHGREE